MGFAGSFGMRLKPHLGICKAVKQTEESFCLFLRVRGRATLGITSISTFSPRPSAKPTPLTATTQNDPRIPMRVAPTYHVVARTFLPLLPVGAEWALARRLSDQCHGSCFFQAGNLPLPFTAICTGSGSVIFKVIAADGTWEARGKPTSALHGRLHRHVFQIARAPWPSALNDLQGCCVTSDHPSQICNSTR